MQAAQTHEELYRRFVAEVPNMGHFEVVDEIFDEHARYRIPGSEPLQGRDAIKKVLGMFRTAFPDLHVTVDAMIAEGERLATLMTNAGTNSGDFMGMGSSGRDVSFPAVHLTTFRGHRIIEDHAVFDRLGLYEQLGFVPTQAT